MTKGTKSILFGVHQFAWHPLTVLMAWIWLYKSMPNWRELICIVIHDWGYWGKKNMDDDEGETHPELGAQIAYRLFDKRGAIFRSVKGCEYSGKGGITGYMEFCLYHSRHYAKKANCLPSKLCWADKLSIIFEPWWLYLPRAWASGELQEYRLVAHKTGHVDISKSHREWFAWVKGILKTLAREKRGDAVPYVNNESHYD